MSLLVFLTEHSWGVTYKSMDIHLPYEWRAHKQHPTSKLEPQDHRMNHFHDYISPMCGMWDPDLISWLEEELQWEEVSRMSIHEKYLWSEVPSVSFWSTLPQPSRLLPPDWCCNCVFKRLFLLSLRPAASGWWEIWWKPVDLTLVSGIYQENCPFLLDFPKL